ncbi:MAG: rhodanese-like domain-containing protein [Bryobacteraceae bacterium]
MKLGVTVNNMTRRVLLSTLGLWAGASGKLWSANDGDPWTSADLMQPAELAAILKAGSPSEHVICVAFPVLYRTRHITGATFAGPTSKPEGIQSLNQTVAQLPKDAAIVLYCGCCPMVRCPNIRPAYRAMKDLGFSRVRVLALLENFHTDWESKGYPVEPAPGTAVG